MRECLLALLLLTCLSARPGVCQSISPEARRYITKAIGLMRKHAPDPRNVDWDSLETETLARASTAQSTSDTYGAITFACRQVMNQQACANFRPPDRAPEKAKAAVRKEWSTNLDSGRQSLVTNAVSPFRGRVEPEAHM